MPDWIRDLNAWAGAVSIAGTALLAIAMLYLRSVFATKADLDLLAGRTTSIEQDVELLDQKAQQAPTQGDFQNLIVAMESVKGDVKALVANMNGVERSVTNIGRNVEMLVENELKGARPSS